MRRVLTFQSKEVLDLVMSGQNYVPDITKCREGANNLAKVWCFDVTDKVVDDYSNGELLERFRCEMSLDQKVGLTQFYLFELLIDDSRVSWCNAHNACSFVYIFDIMYLDDIQAIYTIHHTPFWFYKSIKLYKSFNDNILFPNGLNMFYIGCWCRYLRKYKIYDEDEEYKMLMKKYNVVTFEDMVDCLLDGPLDYIKRECDYLVGER